MSDEAVAQRAAAALARIAEAFAAREPPDVMTDSKQLTDREYEEVMFFRGRRWQDLTFAHIVEQADAVFWFAPEAFCYYLPGFLAAGLREGRCDSNAYDALLGMLDRSPSPENWDDFFRPRWTLLTAAELEAVAAWLEWLAAFQPEIAYPDSYRRALATLTLLRERRGGV